MYKMFPYDSLSVSRVMLTNCPFCYCSVLEDNLVKHINWHYPQDVDDHVDNFEAGSAEDTRIHIEL